MTQFVVNNRILIEHHIINTPVMFVAVHFHSSSENKDIAGNRKSVAVP